MTGLDGQRVYLDWNATAPLRPEARAAMLEAMDVVGNPSSVHAEGRAAKAIVENARGQVAALVGCAPDEVVFTSGATEAATLAFSLKSARPGPLASPIEHECVDAHASLQELFERDSNGVFHPDQGIFDVLFEGNNIVCEALANGETGQLTNPSDWTAENGARNFSFSDITQAAGKMVIDLSGTPVDLAVMSAHKFGGPKGIGATINRSGFDLDPTLKGGGQEKGRRSGTENVVGIAGFGAAAEAARHDLDSQVWDRIEKLRNILEDTLAAAAPDTIFFGKESARLPNTSCFAVPGWKGETQVMQMDLAGFAVSAGSACSSGKVQQASRVLLAMGFDEETASSAIRVSMGPTTTEAEVLAFADAWIDAYRRRKARAA
ncbi:MAG: cysteine desulfurase family protein [Pseudomonadota bacterium]